MSRMCSRSSRHGSTACSPASLIRCCSSPAIPSRSAAYGTSRWSRASFWTAMIGRMLARSFATARRSGAHSGAVRQRRAPAAGARRAAVAAAIAAFGKIRQNARCRAGLCSARHSDLSGDDRQDPGAAARQGCERQADPRDRIVQEGDHRRGADPRMVAASPST